MHEVREVQAAILVGVEELYYIIAVSLCHIMHVVVSKEVQQLHRTNEAVNVSIDSRKKSVGLHVLVGSKVLPLQFEVQFILCNLKEKLLEELLGLLGDESIFANCSCLGDRGRFPQRGRKHIYR